MAADYKQCKRWHCRIKSMSFWRLVSICNTNPCRGHALGAGAGADLETEMDCRQGRLQKCLSDLMQPMDVTHMANLNQFAQPSTTGRFAVHILAGWWARGYRQEVTQACLQQPGIQVLSAIVSVMQQTWH